MSSTIMPTDRLWAAYFREMKYEFVKMLRTPAFSVPTLFFPVMFYLLFGVVLGSMRGNATQAIITFANFGVFGAMGPGLFGFGVSIAIEREYGLLRYKQALPQPAGAYLLARAVMAMLFVSVIAVMLTLVAVTLGKADLSAGQIVSLLLINALGALPFCAIGMWIGWLVSGQAAPAIINFVFLPMAFLSGLFIPLQIMPSILQTLAPVWPAWHLSQMAQSVIGQPTTGTFAGHVAVLAGVTLFFFLLAVRRMHGSGFRLLGRNPKRAVFVATGIAAALVALSFSGVFGGKPAKQEGADAATDAASAATGTPASASAKIAGEPAPAVALLADFDNGSERTAWGNGMLASGDETQGGTSTSSQKVVDGGADGSKSSLEITGEVRPGAPYPSAGTYFFAPGQIMQSSMDISAKKTLSFQVRGDGKRYTFMMFVAGSYIPLMIPFDTGPEWKEVKVEMSRFAPEDLTHILGFGMNSMAQGSFQFQIDSLRLE